MTYPFSLKKLAVYALYVVVLGSTPGCRDDQNEPTPASKPKTKTELLTGKSWRLSATQSVFSAGEKTITTDEYATYEACQKDDLIRYQPDKTLVIDQGSTICASTAIWPQLVEYRWHLTSDETKLVYDFGGVTMEYEILELTETILKFSNSYTNLGANRQETLTRIQTYTAL